MLLSVAVLQQRDDGTNTRFGVIKGQATPLSWTLLQRLSAEPDAVTQLLLLNGSSRRDTQQLLPFIRDQLPKYLSDGPVRVVSYQAGYFPYTLRKFYSPEQVQFFDSVGLANQVVARLPMSKNFIGVEAGTHLSEVLAGTAGPLSEAVARFHPNMIYMLDASPADSAEFSRLGFIKVWDKPGAVIWFRPKVNLPTTDGRS
jgi:hypothetical protein